MRMMINAIFVRMMIDAIFASGLEWRLAKIIQTQSKLLGLLLSDK